MISDEKKEYFAGVVVAENQSGEPIWGPISPKDADKATSLFHCGLCSTEDHRVYHNVLGRHPHISREQLTERIENAPMGG